MEAVPEEYLLDKGLPVLCVDDICVQVTMTCLVLLVGLKKIVYCLL